MLEGCDVTKIDKSDTVSGFEETWWFRITRFEQTMRTKKATRQKLPGNHSNKTQAHGERTFFSTEDFLVDASLGVLYRLVTCLQQDSDKLLDQQWAGCFDLRELLVYLPFS